MALSLFGSLSLTVSLTFSSRARLKSPPQDYGQAVRYRGTVATSPRELKLDSHHVFAAGKMHLVCGNTYRMLKETRFAAHFEFFGDFSAHYGVFPDCGKSNPLGREAEAGGAGPGSCSSGGGGGCC